MTAPIYGLILTGGKSRRMGQDKSQLQMRDGTSQLDYLWSLIEPLVDSCWVSVAKDANAHASYPCIHDLTENQGPLGGIVAALTTNPHTAFLVVACDLPLLNSSTLLSLINQRDETRNITCYLNAHDKRPEPLCAIYEPSALPILLHELSQHKYCARKLVEASNYLGINLMESYALNNANTPQDLTETQTFLSSPPMKKTIHIHYFAQLKTAAEKTEETYETFSATPAGLYDELKMKYGFKFKTAELKVAINDEFCSWDTMLSHNDKIVFMPPVTGG